MSFLIEIQSGQIAAGVVYQVIGGTSVVYNGITYNSGEYFEGAASVTDYTKTAGTEVVTEASTVIQIAIENEPPPFNGILNDTAKVQQLATEAGETTYYPTYTEVQEITNN